MNKLKSRIFLILGVIAVALICMFPIQKRINLGLDLKGGMHVVLHVDTSKLEPAAKVDALPRAIEILRNRIDSLGAGEIVIQRQGDDRILVQLPGITDREKVKKIIGTVANLEFRLVSDDANLLKQALDGKETKGYVLRYMQEDGSPVLLKDTIAVKGDQIQDANVDMDSQGFGQSYVSLKFKGEGGKQFATVTRNNVGRRLAIVLDDKIVSSPNIQEAILGGQAQITGQFSYEEASMLALNLRSGALPAPMTIEEERTVGPLLGKDSIRDGVRASLLGIFLVFVFMGIYYLKAGLVSWVALFLNVLLIFGIMGFLNITLPGSTMTLTLPGIAGIILTLGMAVDANVLINERIREELNLNRPLKAAVNAGFDKAFSAIFDSNLTTLIASFFLFQFGSGPIKGFAITLSIGLLASLFTALFVSRTVFMVLLNNNLLGKSIKMLRLFHNTNFNFIKWRYIAFALSLAAAIFSIFLFVQKKDIAYGIDFAGGQIQEYRFERAVDSDALREALKTVGLGDAVVQQFQEHPDTILIKTSETEAGVDDKVRQSFNQTFPDNKFEILRIETVGPIVGKELRQRALLAIILALGGIFAYVAFRFRHFDFAAAGVIATLHDVIISAGFLLLVGRQIDLLVVTALLTIAGYSMNDTVVIYDRVRENLAKMKGKSFSEIINITINQMLSRTVLTSFVTLTVVAALFFKGGEVLNTFALCLLFGFIVGTYSSIFVASTLVLALRPKKK